MKVEDLQQVRAGFHDEALGSQAIFRSALSALSHPGRVQTLADVAELPRHGHAAAAAFLLAMVDSDCALWLSPALAQTDAATWLRFHTGCSWAAEPSVARFLWIAEGDELPALASLAQGTDEYPDQSATVVCEVAALNGASLADAMPLRLQGPGIATTQSLSVCGLPERFVAQWEANHKAFPRGVDLFLTCATQLVGLPRSTRIGLAGEF